MSINWCSFQLTNIHSNWQIFVAIDYIIFWNIGWLVWTFFFRGVGMPPTSYGWGGHIVSNPDPWPSPFAPFAPLPAHLRFSEAAGMGGGTESGRCSYGHLSVITDYLVISPFIAIHSLSSSCSDFPHLVRASCSATGNSWNASCTCHGGHRLSQVGEDFKPALFPSRYGMI